MMKLNLDVQDRLRLAHASVCKEENKRMREVFNMRTYKEGDQWTQQNFTMYERYDHNKPNAITVIMDGCHNNGGWHVEESVKEVNRMISEQLD
jgi:hypothetical protein